MPDKINEDSISQLLSGLLKNPEISNILSRGKAEKESPPAGESNFSLPPDMMEKLPQIMAMLSGAGVGNMGNPSEKANVPPPSSKSSVGNRKALLRALRPYLSPHRQSVIDSLMNLEGLSGLLGALPTTQTKEENK